mgnify:CR=1 FL=1
MTFEKTFIYKKIEDIERHLTEIKDLLKFSDNEILSDYIKFHAEERLFQLIVDAIIDINRHFIQELDLAKPPEDPQSTFYVLGENKILPEKFAFKMAPVVAIRNRIVHGYETLDLSLFTKNLRAHYSDFEKYIKFINNFLENKP